VLVALVSPALGGCAAAAPPATVDVEAGRAAPPSVRPTPERVGQPDHHDHHDELEASPIAVRTWDAEAREAAVRAAITAVTAFGADAEAVAWWRELAPLLSPSAQEAYAATAPENVPIGTVEYGLLAADDPPSGFVVEVDVGTDVGVYTVLLSRTGAGEPWLVERFIPPTTPEPQP
jgi:hypothetical protein